MSRLIRITVGHKVAAEATSRLGLHVTAGELDIWRQRSVDGPFKAAGDATAYGLPSNSRGEWDSDVTPRKDNFMAGFTPWDAGGLLKGSDGRYYGGNVDSWGNIFTNSKEIAAAAFYALVRQDSTVATAVRDGLLAQVAEPNLQFNDRSLWGQCGTASEPAGGCINDVDPSFIVCEYINRLCWSFDYLRAYEREGNGTIFTDTQRNTILDWFYHAADYWHWDRNRSHTSLFGEGRLDTPPTYNDPGTLSPRWAHILPDGTVISGPGMTRFYNNRDTHILSSVATCTRILLDHNYTPPSGASPGLTLDELHHLGFCYIREFLLVVSARGYQGDYNRNSKDGTSRVVRSLTYASAGFMHTAAMAGMEARLGNESWWNYSTREGFHGTECLTNDPDKTLTWVMNEFAGYSAEIHDRYASDDPAHITYDWKLKTHTALTGRRFNHDILSFTQANLKIKSDLLRQVVERRPGGSYPDIPATYESSGETPYYNLNYAYPAPMLMFAYPDKAYADWPNPYPGG